MKHEDVWPLDSLSLSPITPDLAHHYPRSLRDQAIIALINSTLETEGFEMSVFDELRAIPHFQDLLLRFLRQRSESLGETQAAGQLLGISFEGKTHLNMARFKGLSAQAIGVRTNYFLHPCFYKSKTPFLSSCAFTTSKRNIRVKKMLTFSSSRLRSRQRS